MRVKLFSMYNHFKQPEHLYVEGKPYIAVYNDRYIKGNVEPNSVALLIEPRTILPDTYEYIEKHYDKFKIVFTHDSKLLSCLPNAKRILWGGVYSWSDNPKTKNISFCSADKEYCIEHVRRRQLAFQLQDKIDCMGTYNGGRRVSTNEIYADYKFSICIENFRDDYWFTEKICNAFAHKCVPIYYGARKIGEFFNTNGIVVVENLNDIPKVVDNILYDIDWEYSKRQQFIEENFKAVGKYEVFETWFFGQYDGELEKLWENR